MRAMEIKIIGPNFLDIAFPFAILVPLPMHKGGSKMILLRLTDNRSFRQGSTIRGGVA